jgi:3',5'-cyclic AMP phosphodiesterase CpdA
MAFFFIQMSDPQLGMYATRNLAAAPRTGVTGFAYETERYEKAIAAANRLRPGFVVVTGDLVQDPSDRSQIDELIRINGMLDDGIPLHLVAGNCDVGGAPTASQLGRFRERFGDDNYSFDHGGAHFVVLDSSVAFDPTHVPREWDRQTEFLESDLARAVGDSTNRIVVFMHHPLFGEHPGEGDSTMTIPLERRRMLLDLFHASGVSTVFAGHWHANNYASDGDLEMVTSSAVGLPLGNDPSGIRIVKVYDDRIEHSFYGLDDVPETVELGGREY